MYTNHSYLIKSVNLYYEGNWQIRDILIHKGKLQSVELPEESNKLFDSENYPPHLKIVEAHGLTLMPGFVDVHVHFRQPGFEYKETIQTGSLAAAHGGYTRVCTMPNLNPVPDCKENLTIQLDAINQDACIYIHPYASITKGQKGQGTLVDFDSLEPFVAGFSDDGCGVQSEDLMKQAMINVAFTGKKIVAHCEDNTLLNRGYIHKGRYALNNNHRGICSESEWKQVERDIELVRQTNCPYHVCHISTKETVELIRQAKKEGLPVTCETAPHYLLLNDSDLQEEGRFKMNPPLRDKTDQNALIEGLLDGTIDVIATDHAPHGATEKSKGLEKSAFGIVGLETAFSLLYTHFVLKGIFSLDFLIQKMSTRPRELFNMPKAIEMNEEIEFTLYDLNIKTQINSNSFKSKGKATPFEAWSIQSKCKATFCKNQLITF